MWVLSEIDSQALCYPAFLLVARLRKSYKDGVNFAASYNPKLWMHGRLKGATYPPDC